MSISAIVPCCNEYPQVVFTVQSLINDGVDEVIVVSNNSTDKTNKYFQGLRNPKVSLIIKDDVLSHWQAKNVGIKANTHDKVLFIDGHCIVSSGTIPAMAKLLDEKECGVHAVIHYMLDPRGLEYAFRPEAFYYRFATARKADKPYEVPIMSCCGVMYRQETIRNLGGWNAELGIYGGGEQYINFKQSICGCPQYIHPGASVWHYAEKRGYSWNYTDWVRNQFIAAYCVGGDSWLNMLVELRLKKDRAEVINLIRDNVLQTCAADRAFIASKQVMSFDEFVEKWSK